MIPYPDKPWEDGQQFKYTDNSGAQVVGTYNESKNAWVFTRLQEGDIGGSIGFITTEDVSTVNRRPAEVRDPFEITEDPQDLRTQNETNWWLYEALTDTKDEFEKDQARQDIELEKLKGLAVDRRLYTYAGVDATPQSGQFSSNSNVISAITFLEFGVRDDNDELTPIKSEGDQITITGQGVRVTFIVVNARIQEGQYDVRPVTNEGILDNAAPYVVAFGVDTSALSARVLVGEVKQEAIQRVVETGVETQGEIIEDVATLQNKVAALEGIAIDARWRFETDNRLPNRGEFALRHDGAVVTDWATATRMIVNEIDESGTSYTFEKVAVNDVIRIGAENGAGAEYRITGIEGTGIFTVEYLLSNGDPEDELLCSFTFLSAFDPQGLATIEYVDAQDARKLNLSGGTMTGGLFLGNSRNLTFQKADGSNQFAINPNVTSDYFTNIYTFNSADGDGGVRFRISQDQNLGSSSYDTLLSLSGATQDIGGVEYRGTLALNRVRIPETPDQAANKYYVDQQLGISNALYLPLTGGEMTGDIDMRNARLDTFNAAGEQTMEIAPSGFIKTRDMLRVVRTDNGPALEARDGESSDDVQAKIWVNGNYQFNGTGDLRGDVRLRDNQRFIVRGSANTNVGYFLAVNDSRCQLGAYSGKLLEIKNLNAPSAATDAATKGYVDGMVAPFVTDADVQSAIDNETVHLPLTGGDVSGRVNIQIADGSGAAIRTIGSINVKADNQEIGGSNNFIAHKDYVRVYSTPSGPQDVVNKEYLDERIEAVEAPDLATYATKSFSEDLSFRPAQLRWMYQGKDLGNSKPEDGKFKFDGKFLRCSFKTFNGVDLGVGLVGDTGSVSLNDGPVGIIWYKDANFKWKMKQQFRINSWRWNYNGHFEFARSSKHPDNDSSAFSVGATYYITVGGFF